jgi:hypothetical protein
MKTKKQNKTNSAADTVHKDTEILSAPDMKYIEELIGKVYVPNYSSFKEDNNNELPENTVGQLVKVDLSGESINEAVAIDLYAKGSLAGRWTGSVREFMLYWHEVQLAVDPPCKCQGCCTTEEEQEEDDKELAEAIYEYLTEEEAAQLDRIMEVLKYGMAWLSEHPKDDPYYRYSMETLAHVVACMITQNITNEATPTSDVLEMIQDLPEEDELAADLILYVFEQE